MEQKVIAHLKELHKKFHEEKDHYLKKCYYDEIMQLCESLKESNAKKTS